MRDALEVPCTVRGSTYHVRNRGPNN